LSGSFYGPGDLHSGLEGGCRKILLYLMDTNIEENEPWNRGISARLYLDDIEQRLRQKWCWG